MSDQSPAVDPRSARLWEVFANLRSTPFEASAALLRHSGVLVSEEEAARQLAAARERNTLRLVTASDIPSSWGRRMKHH